MLVSAQEQHSTVGEGHGAGSISSVSERVHKDLN